MMKIVFPYLLVFILCITGYIIKKQDEINTIVHKTISYPGTSASAVDIAWGLNDGTLPPKELWPGGSYREKDLLRSGLTLHNDTFSISLGLPQGSEIYYWIIRVKDSVGKTEVWETGDDNKKFYSLIFNNQGGFDSGYFILLAGLFPLALFFFKQKKQGDAIGYVYNPGIKGYVPQLDSIRAIAVLLVIFHHWLPEKSWVNYLPNGPLGVNTFFVLSGFLITSILLKSKEDIAQFKSSTGTVFKNFYIRRSLRIFPIYYLLLIIFRLLNDPEIQQHGAYYYTYTSNLLFYEQQYFVARFSHLWSLAVEEQFYLIWPFLIIFISKKYLPIVIGIFLTIGISVNYIITGKGWWVNIFTPACFDAFAIGGMLSFCAVYRQDFIALLQKYFNLIFLLSLCLLVTDILKLHLLPSRTIHAIFGVQLVFYCLYQNNNRIANAIFNNKALQDMGKISYGIYLYHLFIPEIWGYVINYASEHNIDLMYNRSIPGEVKIPWLFLQHFALVILISKVSWHLIEKPVNLLKDRFTHQRDKVQTNISKHSGGDGLM